MAGYSEHTFYTTAKFSKRPDGREVVTIVPVKDEIWAVTGTLTLVKRQDGTYGVFNDTYDYDIKPVSISNDVRSTFRIMYRNFETSVGSPSCNNNSGCTSYSISFKGNVDPKMIRGIR